MDRDEKLLVTPLKVIDQYMLYVIESFKRKDSYWLSFDEWVKDTEYKDEVEVLK